jgi:hypothetical protein
MIIAPTIHRWQLRTGSCIATKPYSAGVVTLRCGNRTRLARFEDAALAIR